MKLRRLKKNIYTSHRAMSRLHHGRIPITICQGTQYRPSLNNDVSSKTMQLGSNFRNNFQQPIFSVQSESLYFF